MKSALVAALASLFVAGCTTQQFYYATQSWQRNECNKLIEQNERERCIGRTGLSFDDYKRRTEERDRQ